MADLLAPFRKQDTDEAMKLVKANGFDNLHMAFYKNQDIGKDGALGRLADRRSGDGLVFPW
jgi:hypothetical protein